VSMKTVTIVMDDSAIARLNEIINDDKVSWARAYGYLTGILVNEELTDAMDKLFVKIQKQNIGKF